MGIQLKKKLNGVLRRGSSAWTLMGTPLPPSGLTARLHLDAVAGVVTQSGAAPAGHASPSGEAKCPVPAAQ